MVQGSSSELAQIAANLQELDLTDNLLSNWDILSQLGGGLPQLKCLNLTSNVLTFSDETPHLPNTALQILVLNSCKLSWSDVRACAVSVAQS